MPARIWPEPCSFTFVGAIEPIQAARLAGMILAALLASAATGTPARADESDCGDAAVPPVAPWTFRYTLEPMGRVVRRFGLDLNVSPDLNPQTPPLPSEVPLSFIIAMNAGGDVVQDLTARERRERELSLAAYLRTLNEGAAAGAGERSGSSGNIVNDALRSVVRAYRMGGWHVLAFGGASGDSTRDSRPTAPDSRYWTAGDPVEPAPSPLVLAGAEAPTGGYNGRMEILGILRSVGHFNVEEGLRVSHEQELDVWSVTLNDGTRFVLAPRHSFNLRWDDNTGGLTTSYGGEFGARFEIPVASHLSPIAVSLAAGPDVVYRSGAQPPGTIGERSGVSVLPQASARVGWTF
ncbi:MAG: hypothetical protein IT285_04400 [Bdellovibrionales bacterium]|nr:hypothetical protein [Bdellovibrionales bacterium]